MTRPLTLTQRTFIYLTAGLLIVVFTAKVEAITVVSPAGLENTDGNILFFPANNPFPNTPDPPLPPFTEGWRAQELHPALAFDSLGTGPFELTRLAWRPDISVNEPTSTEWNLTLKLSTTQVGTLSGTFANNFGPSGATEVFSGTLPMQTDGIPKAGGLAHEFEYVVDFHTPYVYDPGQGDLLIEFAFTTEFSDQWAWVDADDRTGEFVFGFSADAEEAAVAGPGVFVTELTVIPEPATIVFAALGLASLFTWRITGEGVRTET